MKRNLFLGFVLGGLGFGAYVSFAVVDFPVGKIVYVRKTENIRAEPQGEIRGQLQKGTAVTVLEDTPNWVKVRTEAWIWKESLAESKVGLAEGAMRAKQIVVTQLSKAETILEQLQKGANFEELAKKHSIGPAASKGGDLGYFQKGDFQPEFEEIILRLKPGEVSNVVKGTAGYHIFKRIE